MRGKQILPVFKKTNKKFFNIDKKLQMSQDKIKSFQKQIVYDRSKGIRKFASFKRSFTNELNKIPHDSSLVLRLMKSKQKNKRSSKKRSNNPSQQRHMSFKQAKRSNLVFISSIKRNEKPLKQKFFRKNHKGKCNRSQKIKDMKDQNLTAIMNKFGIYNTQIESFKSNKANSSKKINLSKENWNLSGFHKNT